MLSLPLWPLAFEIGSGAEFRAPMARAVIGGLIISTLLTLIVVPVVYTYLVWTIWATVSSAGGPARRPTTPRRTPSSRLEVEAQALPFLRKRDPRRPSPYT
jgi:hypothetical protein